MENNPQQQQALDYFKEHAQEWLGKGKTVCQDQVNVIQQRNDYVLRVIEKREKTELVLDVGCGTGDLVHEIAKRGIRAVGVDFAEEMIKIARDNPHPAEFVCGSIFDYDFNNVRYDVISANGFIEYIPLERLNDFLEISYNGLNDGGSLVLGSRNRLFDIFSLNDFTKNEINDGNSDLLLSESVALVQELSLRHLACIETAPLPKIDEKQPNTGIDVSIRLQYTPVQLMKLLKDKGFETTHISPVHIHGVVPEFKDQHPAIHGIISNLLQTYAEENMALIPFSSSFMIHAKKRW